MFSQKRHLQWTKYLFFLWLILILVVSSIPRLPNPNLEMGNKVLRVDYMIHWLEYAILSGLFVLWRIWVHQSLDIKLVLMALALGFFIGAADEIHQLLIPGRRFNPYDMAYNFLGVISGILFAILYYHIILKKQFTTPPTSQQPL